MYLYNFLLLHKFHSEIKTDMDIEKLPSSKFSTNEIVLGLGGMVYNVLRLIGKINCKLETKLKETMRLLNLMQLWHLMSQQQEKSK